MSTAWSIIVKVFNERRNSDLLADDPAMLAALDREFEARDKRISELLAFVTDLRNRNEDLVAQIHELEGKP